MSDAVLVALIAAVPATLALLVGLRSSSRAADAKVAATQASAAVTELTLRVDGRLDELLAATRAQGHSEGVSAEQARTHAVEV